MFRRVFRLIQSVSPLQSDVFGLAAWCSEHVYCSVMFSVYQRISGKLLFLQYFASMAKSPFHLQHARQGIVMALKYKFARTGIMVRL